METQPSVARCKGCGIDHVPGSPGCPLVRVGTVIAGRYRLDRLLGLGGMGAVYEAENLQLGRRVALKLLHPELASRPDVVNRFRREARSVAALKHHGFAQVFALDADETGQFFIEMELLEGDPIDRLIRNGPLPIDKCIAIMSSTLEALAIAHDAGLVHRDLKPENLFLCRDARLGEYVKILDFGIAQSNDGLRMTASGQFMGTVAYASPEQLRDAANVDARSDIYSFAATAFEIVTRTSAAGGGSYAEVMTRIMTDVGQKSVRAVRADAPAWLDALIARGLAADPAMRWANAGETRAALQGQYATSIAIPQPITGAQPTQTATGSPPPRPRSKSRWLLVAGGLVIAGVTALVTMLQLPSTRSAPAVAAVEVPGVDAPVAVAAFDAGAVEVPGADAHVAPAAPDAGAVAIRETRPSPPSGSERRTSDPKNRAPGPVTPTPSPGSASSARDEAAQYNEAGKAKLFAGNHAGAAADFREAIARDPRDARYFFNLCTTYFSLADYAKAKKWCTDGLSLEPKAALRAKFDKLLQKIADEAANQGIALP